MTGGEEFYAECSVCTWAATTHSQDRADDKADVHETAHPGHHVTVSEVQP